MTAENPPVLADKGCDSDTFCCPEKKRSHRGMARRQAILDAAAELFLEKGFSATSLSEIVSRSRGSRATLYKLFGNKEGLLKAMIEDVAKQTWTAIDHYTLKDDHRNVEQILTDLATFFISKTLSPVSTAIFRIFAAESQRIPEITALFHELGPAVVERKLAPLFANAPDVREGRAAPEALARMFLGLATGTYHFRTLIGFCHKPGQDEIDAHVKVAVRIFLQGMGPIPRN